MKAYRIILTILIICTFSGCGGGSSESEEETIQNCPAVPDDFIGPVKPCPAQ